MLATNLAELCAGGPAGVEEALDLVAGFDHGLVDGLGRLGEERVTALTRLAGALTGTPLGQRVGEAVEKTAAGSVGDDQLAALAGARAALLGAVHDALLDRFDAATGRSRAPWPQPPAAETRSTGTEATVPDAGNLLAACRSWLNEVAITGWRNVDHDLVAAAGQIMPALLAQPGLRRLAVLLDGLAAELQAAIPASTMRALPVRRWADLWARALLLAQAEGWAPAGGWSPADSGPAGQVSGRLLILGVELHEHATAVQAQVHAILEPTGGEPRLVRTSVAAAKVDTITGPAVWQLLSGFPVLLAAVAGHRGVEFTDLTLLDSGDLRWRDDRARLGEPADPFATARVQLAGALAPAVAPLERHPVRIAEPVLLEGYSVTAGTDTGRLTIDLGGNQLAVAVDRLPAAGPLTPELVASSSACLGLIRWDAGEWLLQPIAVQTTVKRRTVGVHGGDWALGPTDPKVAKAAARAGDALAVLRERAGRLLRR